MRDAAGGVSAKRDGNCVTLTETHAMSLYEVIRMSFDSAILF